MLRKIISAIIAVSMVLVLASCGETKTADDSNTTVAERAVSSSTTGGSTTNSTAIMTTTTAHTTAAPTTTKPKTTAAKTTQRKKVTVSEKKLDKSYLGVPLGGGEDNKEIIKRVFIKPVLNGGNKQKTAETNEYIDDFCNNIIKAFPDNEGHNGYEINYRHISYNNIGFLIFDELFLESEVIISFTEIIFDEYTGERLSNDDVISRFGLSKSKVYNKVKNDYNDFSALNQNDKIYDAIRNNDDEWKIGTSYLKDSNYDLNQLSHDSEYLASFDKIKIFVDSGSIKCLYYYYETIADMYIEHTLGKISEFKK